MVVYVDIILLENLCMNFIILFATSYIMKLQAKIIKMFFASLLGSVYAIAVYLDALPIYSNILMKILLSICMVYIAYMPKRIKGLLKELIVFYLVSFALGGCAFALLYIIKPQEIFIKNGVYIGTYPLKIALLGGIVGFVITYVSFKIVKSKIRKDEIIYSATIKIGEKIEETKILLDTGNMLKDPITNAPVILIEKEILKKLLPDELVRILEQANGGDIENIDEKYKKRIRIIPFSSVGKQNGMMWGIKADEVAVITDVNEVINNDAIVCIYNKSFSKSKKYFGLMGVDMLETTRERKGEQNELFADIKK